MCLRNLFILLLAFLATSSSAQRQQPFEGVITYLVTTDVKQKDNPYNKYYTEKYGDTLTIFYHKSGSERREYNNTGAYGLDWEIYNKFNNEVYSKWHGIDSAFYSSSADTATRLLSLWPSDTMMILDKPCASITKTTLDELTGEMDRQTLYFSGDEYIPPHAYKGRRKGHIDKFYAESKSLFLRWDVDAKYVQVIYEAISIEPQTIDPNIFITPNGMAKIKNKK